MSSKSELPTSISSDTATYLAPTPFEHPDYRNLDAATYEAVGEYTSGEALTKFARVAGLHHVMRWKPMNVRNTAVGSFSNTDICRSPEISFSLEWTQLH